MTVLKSALLLPLVICLGVASPAMAQTRPDLWMLDRSVGQAQPEPLRRMVALVGERLQADYVVSHASRLPSRPGRALHLGAVERGDTLAVSAVMSSIRADGSLTFHADWIFTCSVAQYEACADTVAARIRSSTRFWPAI